ERSDLVHQVTLCAVDVFALPRQPTGEDEYRELQVGARSDDGGSLGVAIWDLAGRRAAEEVVEVWLGHGGQVGQGDGHGCDAGCYQSYWPLAVGERVGDAVLRREQRCL